MAISPANRHRWVASFVLAGVSTVLGALLLLTDACRPASYDLLHQLAAGRALLEKGSPVVIVYLDLNSYSALRQDPLQPWSRRLHAELLRRLTQAGARAVVFDIVFGGPGPDAVADDALATAMRQHGRVVIAGESSGKNSHAPSAATERLQISVVSPPFALFATNAAAWGLASHMIEDDYVVRQYLAGGLGPESSPSLTWALARVLQLGGVEKPGAMEQANFRYLSYRGPPLTLPHVSYAQALDKHAVPDAFFRGKVVFIGARPITGLFQTRQDEFRSPFHSWGNRELFMPGVEVHATEMLGLLEDEWLVRWPALAELGLVIAVALGFGAGLIWLRPALAIAAAGLGVLGIGGLAAGSFGAGHWFSWLVPAIQIPAALGGAALYRTMEWYQARRRLEAAKRAAEAQIREQAALIEKAHDAILVQDLTGEVRYANPSACRLYGLSASALQRPGGAAGIFAPDPAQAEVARKGALTAGEWNGEMRQQGAGGQILTMASRWTLIRDEAGQPRQLLMLNTDITEQKSLEQQFLRTQRLNTIGALAGGMAHDLNNALAPILLGAQLLHRKAGDEETRGLLRLLETSAQRGADMVRQVLLFARGRGGETERLSPGAVLKEMAELARETFPRSVLVEQFVASDLWPVRGNLTQLHQVLLNLCVNARDVMPGGGKLTLAADNFAADEAPEGGADRQTDLPTVLAPDGWPARGRFVSLLVADTGAGMPAEVLHRIFEPFFTTKGEGKGTGIGLATVLRIVRAHGGFLRVESKPGEGTTFEVLLPAASEEPTPAPAPLETLPGGNGELLLLADDEQAFRELVSAELKSAGYRVLAAANGAEAVRLCREHATQVCLFITDGAMPVLDGAGAIAQVRTLSAGLPVVWTSGQAEDQAALPPGVMVVSKPFALAELLSVIHQALKDSPRRKD